LRRANYFEKREAFCLHQRDVASLCKPTAIIEAFHDVVIEKEAFHFLVMQREEKQKDSARCFLA
jgi:hypothetical protein